MLECLLVRVVAVVAQRLPVLLVPEQPRVALVRHDVVDHGSGRDKAATIAIGAKRTLTQVCNAALLPAQVVAAFTCRFAMQHHNAIRTQKRPTHCCLSGVWWQ